MGFEAPVLVAFGSNLGNRAELLRRGVELVSKSVRIFRCSSLYETAPMYVEDQPSYLNGALSGFTELGPLALLAQLKRIEVEVGRRPRVRNGPRELDLDLIAYGVLELRSTVLRLPHSGLRGRRFVLEPLAEIDADSFVPICLGVARALEDPKVREQEVTRVPDG